MDQKGQVTWGAAGGKFSQFSIEEKCSLEAVSVDTSKLLPSSSPPSTSAHTVHARPVCISSLGNAKKGWFVSSVIDSVSQNPSLSFSPDATPSSCSLFVALELSPSVRMGVSSSSTATVRLQKPHLSTAQKVSFLQNGFLHLPGIVPRSLIDDALRRINNSLGRPGSIVPEFVGGVGGKLAGNVTNADEIRALFLSPEGPLLALVESLLGDDTVDPPIGAQIALRFPEDVSAAERSALAAVDLPGTQWHIDGMRKDSIHPFSVLVGVCLSDVLEPLQGNLAVFPGSHHTLHTKLKESGKGRTAQEAKEGVFEKAWQSREAETDGTLPDLGRPLQLTARRGDAFIVHHMVAHRPAPNHGPDIRYQIYFRVRKKGHSEPETVPALFWEFEGVQALL